MNFPYSDKERAKSRGARWDRVAKKWYFVVKDHDERNFVEWLGTSISTGALDGGMRVNDITPENKKKDSTKISVTSDVKPKKLSLESLPTIAAISRLESSSSRHYIAFDFETSGLPTVRPNGPITQESIRSFDSCRAVSLSAASFSLPDINGGTVEPTLIDTFDTLIIPEGFTIGQESLRIHGISESTARDEGKPIGVALKDFLNYVDETRTLVAHNIHFDQNVLRSEFMRLDMDLSVLDRFQFRCTNELYKKRYKKNIKLVNLYKKVYDNDFENAHASLADAKACGRVYPFCLSL